MSLPTFFKHLSSVGLAFFISISPTLASAETYVCAFQCFTSEETCQMTFSRDGSTFRDQLEHEYFFKEDDGFLLLSSLNFPPQFMPDVARTFSVTIEKQSLKFMWSVTMYNTEKENLIVIPRSVTQDYKLGQCTKID